MKNITLLTFIILGTPVFGQINQPMNDFFGVNVHGCTESIDDIDNIANWIRDYSHWEYFEPTNNKYLFNDAINVKDSSIINYDEYYQKLKQADVNNLLCIMDAPKWASSHPNDPLYKQFAPCLDQSGLKPEHYKEAAEFYFQLIARYGTMSHNKKSLKSKDKMSGMDLVDVVEVENEPDGPADWGDQITLEEYAALLNAVYDGNSGEMGPGYGVKKADPKMPVSIGGLAFNLKAMKEIIKYAGRQPFDIINIHFYTFKHIREDYRVATPPEWSSLEYDIKEIAEWRDENAKEKPIWLTEIGWDTRDYSTEGVTEQEAANYLIRSYLLSLGAGAEKCFWFYFKDLDNSKHPIVFSSSGLFENEEIPWHGSTRLKPKMPYWYNATFKNLTQDYVFQGEFEVLRDSTVRKYDFISRDSSKRLSIMWYCPAERERWYPLPDPLSISYDLETPKGWHTDKVYKPKDGSSEGELIPLNKTDRHIRLTLDGTPLFIFWKK